MGLSTLRYLFGNTDGEVPCILWTPVCCLSRALERQDVQAGPDLGGVLVWALTKAERVELILYLRSYSLIIKNVLRSCGLSTVLVGQVWK